MTRIRPKLAWRVGLVVVAALLIAFGASRGAYVIAAMLALFALYAWTTTVELHPEAIEKRPWGRNVERVPRPLTELEYLHVPSIGRRAIEFGPIGSSLTLELGFWNRPGLRIILRQLVPESETLGDDDSRARILGYAGIEEVL